MNDCNRGGRVNEVSGKRFHIAIRLSEEEKWKLREIAVRQRLKVSELVRDMVLVSMELIETEYKNKTGGQTK